MKKSAKTERKAEIREALGRLERRSTRMDAIAWLAEAGAIEAVGPLLDLGRRGKKEERAAICQALAQMGEPAVKPLIREGLKSKDADVRRCAARALAGMGPQADAAVNALLDRLKNDKSTGMRMEAAEALGKVGDLCAAEPLVALLNSKDRRVRERGAVALSALGEGAVEATHRAFAEDVPSRARIAAAYALGAIGGPRAESILREAFADPSHPSRLRVAILSALYEALGAGMLPMAIVALGEEDAHVRQQAVRCMCEEDTPESTAHLATLYADGDRRVRAWALEALGERRAQLLARVQAGEEDALRALLAVWGAMGRGREDERVEIGGTLAEIGQPLVPALVAVLAQPEMRTHAKVGAIEVLARIGPLAVKAYDMLVSQLEHSSVALCCAAARALGALGDERAVLVLAGYLRFDGALLKAKKGEGNRARKRALALQACAAEGLGRLGRVALATALQAARSDDPISRRGGALALGHIGGGRALAALDQIVSNAEPMVREAAADALERLAAEDVRRLDEMLRNKDERVRARAVRALSKLDDLRSLDLLLRAYGDPSARVNKAVVDALAQREGERADSVLIAAAAGGNVSAIDALRAHPIRQAIPALLEALDSPWRKVHDAALVAILTYAEVFRSEDADDPEAMTMLREAIPELVSFLYDDSAKMRRLALEGLAAFGDAGTVPDIAYMLQDEKERVRLAAVRSLAAIGGEEVVVALQSQYAETKDEDLREAIAGALARMGADAG
jgi:HEAT repeat protein